MSKKEVYADFAAATPVAKQVQAAMQPYLADSFYNPSSIYLNSVAVTRDIEAARDRISKVISAKPSEIIFTAGATESCNLAIAGVMQQYPKANLIISAVEHSAVSLPAEQYSARVAPVDKTGLVDLKELEALIDDQTVLVSVIYGNNEIGTVQALSKIAQLIKQIKDQRLKQGNELPLLLHTDAAQAPNYLHLEVNRLGVDLMTLNSAKVYGPKQVGLLYVRTGVELQPIIRGGGQEMGLRGGTENVAGVVGFAKALEIASKSRQDETKKLQKLVEDFEQVLLKEFPNAIINSTAKDRLPNIVNISFPSLDGERLVMELDELGVMCATGAACNANTETRSKVLLALGLNEEIVDGSIRFSFGRTSTKADTDYIVKCLQEIVPKQRELSK